MATLRARGGRSLTTIPPIRISPSVGCSRPAISRISVVLPQPDGPSRTRNSPSAAARSMPSTARTSSKCLKTRRASTVAMERLTAPIARGPLDQTAVLPLGPYCLHFVLGPLERVLRRLGAGGALGEHGVDHPGLIGVGDGSGGVARVAYVGGPIERVSQHGIFVGRYGLGVVGDQLLDVRHCRGEAREVVEFARLERLAEVVDVVDQELLCTVPVLGK